MLIDEIDRADDEFEAYLLEVLSDYQITIPELGRFTAAEPPLVVVAQGAQAAPQLCVGASSVAQALIDHWGLPRRLTWLPRVAPAREVAPQAT